MWYNFVSNMLLKIKTTIYLVITNSIICYRSLYWKMFLKKMGKNVTIQDRCKIMDANKIVIGNNVLISHNTDLYGHGNITIGDHTQIGAYSAIISHNHIFSIPGQPIREQGHENEEVIIGKDVWLGTHVIVLPGVTIGDGSVIGAGSIVTKPIPAYSVAVGNPAKVIKRRY